MSTVLITGCSSGFGLLSAVTAAKAGFRVFATMRNLDKRAELDAAAEAAGVELEVLRLDVCDPASVESGVKEVLQATDGELWGLVNNAGIGLGGAFETIEEEKWRGVFDTNVFGTFRMTQAVLPTMRERRRGRIITVGSMAGLIGEPFLSIYVSTKHALEGWHDSVSYEVEPFGVKMVLLEPGAYATNIWDSSERVFGDDTNPYAGALPFMLKAADRSVKMAADPQEVADRIVECLKSPNPRSKYPMGLDARAISVGRKFVPSSALKAGVRLFTGLNKWKP